MACSGPAAKSTPDPTATPQPTPTPRAAANPPGVNLPADEGIHLAPVEWWYFNGHLTDSAGNRYSFHFVTFLTVTGDGQIPQLLQLSLADHQEGVYLTDEKPALQTELQPTNGRFSFDLAGWHMSGNAEAGTNSYQLAFHTGEYSLDLAANPGGPTVLHQGEGLVDLGRAGKTYYYSRPNLEVSGTLTKNGTPVQVTGKVWMDHQWGDFSTQPVGWDWVSLQMDDGSALMVSLVWDSSNGQPIISYGTYIPAGSDATSAEDPPSRHLPEDEISLSPTDTWTSPATGVEYPSGWLLKICSLDMEVNLVPVQENAEFGDSEYVPIAYWEGEVTVSGKKGGNSIAGDGFVELVGYDKGQREPGLPK